jgi:hypothetical protein
LKKRLDSRAFLVLYSSNKRGHNMKDKRTNKNYNPTVEFNKAINSDWFKTIVTRMGSEVNIKKMLVEY